MEELKTWWHGAHVDHAHLSKKNLVNALIFFLGFVPSIIWISVLYKDPIFAEIDQFDKMDFYRQLNSMNMKQFA